MAFEEYAGRDKALRIERKYTSPRMQDSSMTPPRSSQQVVPRTPTPTHPHLYSPPPTTRTALQRPVVDISSAMFGADQIDDATPEELRSMVREAAAACREARAVAAHRQLQHELYRMGQSEAAKRAEVELAMARREVEVLQAAALKKSPVASRHVTPSISTDELLNTLRQRCQSLEEENETLQNRLKQAKALILEREFDMHEESDRLRERISTNRKHTNLLRQTYSQQENTLSLPSSASYLGHQFHSTMIHPSQIPGSTARREGSFAALLLADQVLNREAASIPMTPSKRNSRKAPSCATRSARVAATVPSTPDQPRSSPSHVAISSQQFQTSSIGRRQRAMIPQPLPTPSYHRRDSRDSTISASDGELGRCTARSNHDITVTQNQHRGTATAPGRSMLRTPQTPKIEQFVIPQSTGFVQTKIQGKVTKPGLGRTEEQLPKRKSRQSDATPAAQQSKRGRMEEGVGLGIGGLMSP